MQAEIAHKDAQLARNMRRRRQARNRTIRRLVGAVLLLLVIVFFVVGEVYAGSPSTLADGTTIAGVNVGGLTTKQAVSELDRRAATLANVPVPVRVAGHTFPLHQSDLGISVYWTSAVESARSSGEVFGPIRGFRRL